MEKWWQSSVVYQIYPRSFQDSNGDGVGDIAGITSRLEYLEKLGIDVIWLSPVYKSPNDDNGYDISDYEAILPEFGTMADMDELIREAKQRGIQIIMDLVVNHTSDEHPWFKEAKKSKTNPYRDYYIWRDSVNGGPPNDLQSIFSGSAWEFDKETNQYYFHLFSKRQPDLNWENPAVQEEVWKLMNFWLAKGIGGFRMDVIDLIGKIPDKGITGNGPKLHEYLKKMHKETFGKYDVLTVGETWGATPEIAKLYSNPDREELSMVFQFEHISLDELPGKSKWDLQPLDFIQLKAILSKWQTALGDEGWNSLFWNNHDLPRIISRWGNDSPKYRVKSGKMLATILHLMKGTPYIYQGEEIGMVNTPVSSIEELDDIESLNMYRERLAAGYDKADILASINKKGRDNARRPMQWSNHEHGGFTTGTPWLELSPRYSEINVENELADSESLFYHYQRLIQLRKNNPLVVWGTYQELVPNDTQLFVYERSYENETWLIVANFYEEEADFSHESHKVKEIILSNYSDSSVDLANLHLRAYETVVYRLEK
ncbi:alpha-glucosidase [Carnobacterium maltaromaticum]|uniref:glycoside hydrolase family 13 protein n=1 Tax=Carnobacterium maltaromaticum TaxID=2751 RepID=UPI000704E4BF|nr:alpha-glucosidase [Carnobacterium maltaromaticum]KRN84447.1 putative glucan 1,6-alpha-glucosidase [Carnobacterium maltaromaticum]MDT1944057.1 alpha-glucosidase [Carnobacterium maltaromaticum]MDT1999437.1 alpha-glucosidase [Carnobacterium maltaromaticum]TFJ24135.1 alpha-glucosidase [Carnobacterium maltaromaticum]TFJ29540.1 alpha-glucosidase [Carnobacterium maltaromaticum]